jgi:hypothetical protein
MTRKRHPQTETVASALDRLAAELRPALVSLTVAGETAAVAAVFRANGTRIGAAYAEDRPHVHVGVIVNRPTRRAVAP